MRTLFLAVLIAIPYVAFSQVYNSFPLSNIEINPSYAVSDLSDLYINISHIDNFSASKRFSQNNILVSKKFKSIFTSTGLMFSKTNIYDTVKYQYAGILLAYRNILFNKFYIKLGLNCKYIDINAPTGNFTRYNYKFSDSFMQKTSQSNFNFSASVSSAKENYYLVYGLLNQQPTWLSSEDPVSIFPQYQYLKLGNFAKLFSRIRASHISLLFLHEKMDKKQNWYYYLNYFRMIQLTRRHQILLGGDAGFSPGKIINLKPTVSYYKYYRKKNSTPRRRRRTQPTSFYMFKFSADIGINLTQEKDIYKPAYQFSFILNH